MQPPSVVFKGCVLQCGKPCHPILQVDGNIAHANSNLELLNSKQDVLPRSSRPRPPSVMENSLKWADWSKFKVDSSSNCHESATNLALEAKAIIPCLVNDNFGIHDWVLANTTDLTRLLENDNFGLSQFTINQTDLGK